jgi:hypothetical protein
LYINGISDGKKKNQGETNKSPKSAEETASKTSKALSLPEKRALEFLTQNYSLYEMNSALAVCQLHNFRVIFFI